MALILLQLTTKNLGFVKPETWWSITNLDPGPHIVDLHILCRNRPDQPHAIRAVHQGYNMERSRQFAIKHGYDYMFIVQSDIIFPPNTLLVLLEAMKKHDAGVVCPLTPERPEKIGTDDFVVCMRWNKNPHAREAINVGEDFRVTGCGSGYMCVLVRKDVFQKFEFPAEGSGDMHWYSTLQKAKVEIFCHVGSLRVFHKQWSDDRIIRGNVYVVQHWREIIRKNIKNRKNWYRGLPQRWWWSLTPEEFLRQLPNHIDKERVWWTW